MQRMNTDSRFYGDFIRENPSNPCPMNSFLELTYEAEPK